MFISQAPPCSRRRPSRWCRARARNERSPRSAQGPLNLTPKPSTLKPDNPVFVHLVLDVVWFLFCICRPSISEVCSGLAALGRSPLAAFVSQSSKGSFEAGCMMMNQIERDLPLTVDEISGIQLGKQHIQYIIWCSIIPRHDMLYSVILYYVLVWFTLFYVALMYIVVICGVMLCCIMLYAAMLCPSMLCYIVMCCVMIYYIIIRWCIALCSVISYNVICGYIS